MYDQVALIIIILASEISAKFEIFPKVPNFIQYGESKTCQRDSDIYSKNLGNYTMWAHKMLDSSAKGAFGVLRGNEYQLGNYEECLNIYGPFPTQYCLVGITINVPPRNSTDHNHRNQYETVFARLEHYKVKNVKFGMCFPSSCSASDIQSSFTKSLNKMEKPFKTVDNITYTVTSSKELCSDFVNPKRFGILEKTFCILSVTLFIFALIGTIGDCLGKTEENPNKFIFKKLCLSFSIRRNWSELFKAYGHQEETNIFNGIRSISVIIIFFGHYIQFLAFIPTLNSLTIDEIFNSKARLVLEKIDLVVDIFFLMSGLLLVHGIFKKWKAVYFNPIWLIFLRYIRLTPLNLYASLYFVTMLPYFASGPLWNLSYLYAFKSCVQNNNWWLNIFYINNFMTDATESCNEVNWYIACDFQLFIFGVIVMLIMKKNLHVGYAVLGFLFTLSIIVTFTISKIYAIVPYMETYENEQYKLFYNNYYIKPYTRAPCYFLGMLGGIIYDKLKSKGVTISKRNSYAVTGISLLLMGVSYTYLSFFYNGQENYMFEFALYNALHRPIWCIGVLGICIVTSFGSIPAIRVFLSSSFWTPFAKLSYGLYLIHVIIQYATITTSTTANRTEFLNTASLFFALLVPTFIISSFWYVIVEAPCVQFFKIITPPKFYEKPLIATEENGTVEEGTLAKIQ